MADFTVKKIDKGWDRIQDELVKMKTAHVDCGMLSISGAEENGFNLVRLATIQEFGHKKLKIPERPFMRNTFDTQLVKIQNFLKNKFSSILKGTDTTYTALESAGIWHVSEIKKNITNGPWKKNAPSTLLANWRKHHKGAITKGEALQNDSGLGTEIKKPLIDSSVMRNSLTHIVVKS